MVRAGLPQMNEPYVLSAVRAYTFLLPLHSFKPIVNRIFFQEHWVAKNGFGKELSNDVYEGTRKDEWRSVAPRNVGGRKVRTP